MAVGDFVVVSHIQRTGCQPERTLLHGGHSHSWSAEQEKENKKKSLAAPPPPLVLELLGGNKIKLIKNKKKHMARTTKRTREQMAREDIT